MIKTISIQGHRLRAFYRPGQGIPLVLCNGWGANLETFGPLGQALGDRALLSFDVPGLGGSPLPKYPLRLAQLANLVELLCRHYELDQVDVGGYSWGGLLAQELARRNPQMVRRLILLATSPGQIMIPAWPQGLLAFADHRWLSNWRAPKRFFERDFLCRVGPRLFGGDVLQRNPMAVLPLLALMQPPSLRALAWQLGAVLGWSSLPWLTQLEQPTLILGGRDDRVVNPLNLRLLNRLIPDARLRWVDGGHLFPVLDAPAVSARHILAFVDEHPKVVPLARRRKHALRRAG